jgi:hypothetical protein
VDAASYPTMDNVTLRPTVHVGLNGLLCSMSKEVQICVIVRFDKRMQVDRRRMLLNPGTGQRRARVQVGMRAARQRQMHQVGGPG